MSASLARSVFKPVPAATSRIASSSSSCPVSSFFAKPSSSAPRPGVSARTANAVAHLTVAAALLASAVSFVSKPDQLPFSHPPRSAISWEPTKHIAVREKNAPLFSSSSPASPSSSSSSFSASSIAAPTFPSPPTVAAATAAVPRSLEPLAHELRLAGIIGRSIGH
ncbi:hypothetical protein JCM8547_008248 [Rhodosporidiobolus lusitaniae]